MKRILFLLFFICSVIYSDATHIVGGEFEMVYRGDTVINNKLHFNFNISLILYFDLLGNPEAQDDSVMIRIFRKRDNKIVADMIPLNFMSASLVEYFQPACSEGVSLRTNRLFYTYRNRKTLRQAVYSLSPEEYADSQGYYLAWERCCRNYTITNVFSQDPVTGGIYAGQTFYLEFPPLKKDGKLFINSSPRLFPPLSDYACPATLYYVDFSGTDPDGDSLVYTLTTPLNTHTEDALPPVIFPAVSLPRPGPYPLVRWQPPFSLDNIMEGKPDLKISPDGLLTVVPKFQGLYVFSVKCEEFRNGVRIGEVRRDFQMLVLAQCEMGQPPVVEARRKGSADPFVKDNLNVAFLKNDDRCIEVRVTDPDSQNASNDNKENVHIRAIPIGFKNKDLNNDILPDVSTAVLENGGNVIFTVCFPECPYMLGPYQIGIIAGDNACPLPRLDTIIVTVDTQLPDNKKPYFEEFPGPGEIIVLEGKSKSLWEILGKDDDLDSMSLIYEPVGFKFEDYGFTYDSITDKAGEIERKLTLDTRCKVIDFSKKTDFEIKFVLNDKDKCDLIPPDTTVMNVHVDLIDVHSPTIEYGPNPGESPVFLTRKIYESIAFEVIGRDIDSNDELNLFARGDGFGLPAYNMSFPPIEKSTQVITSNFNWKIDCKEVDLKVKDEFALQFIVVDDNNRCGYYLADTLSVFVKVEPPDNLQPELEIINLNKNANVQDTLLIQLGDKIDLAVNGIDLNIMPADDLEINLISAEGNVTPKGYEFTNTGNRTSKFTWYPDCSIFENAIYENDYTFGFSVKDNRCFNIKGDTTYLPINIRDIEPGAENFLPPNWISPNNDNRNDFFAMVKEDENGQQVNILPKDNCAGRFVSIIIYNRWGKEVFISRDRDFRWFAKDASVGVYFYSLHFSDKEYKGTVSVRF